MINYYCVLVHNILLPLDQPHPLKVSLPLTTVYRQRVLLVGLIVTQQVTVYLTNTIVILATPTIETVIVYGSGLAVYTAVEGLLKESVAADRIVMVQPHPPTCFNNSVVEDHVSKTLNNIGMINIIKECN